MRQIHLIEGLWAESYYREVGIIHLGEEGGEIGIEYDACLDSKDPERPRLNINLFYPTGHRPHHFRLFHLFNYLSPPRETPRVDVAEEGKCTASRHRTLLRGDCEMTRIKIDLQARSLRTLNATEEEVRLALGVLERELERQYVSGEMEGALASRVAARR